MMLYLSMMSQILKCYSNKRSSLSNYHFNGVYVVILYTTFLACGFFYKCYKAIIGLKCYKGLNLENTKSIKINAYEHKFIDSFNRCII